MLNSDSDDDKPIIELIKKRKAQAASEALKKAAAAPAPKRVKLESSEAVSKKSASSSNDKAPSNRSSSKSASSSSTFQLTEDFYETDKGMMVRRLLCRWWYALSWPKPEDIGTPPAGYEPLDGFPGVFISTRSDALGKIVDLRDKSSCPCLKVFASWSSAKIQRTCITAYEAQMEMLKQYEGEDCSLYQQLRKDLREVKKVDPDKADREARKFDFSSR